MNKQSASELLKAMGHPVRLQILEGLARHGCNVGRIVAALGLPQSTVSQHLSVMRKCGVIVPQKKGVKTCYRVVDERALKILNILK
ncbi:MAG: metalloregulator ArsR/SmtB family transcription factor [Candidatus Omnitrophica bacterium]|nr:metalloregulator ArsR/SmtB family transcription factor [Candidatus Omnitrophota bacterium]MDD5573603.1 metalloregulator ArsR/SmtB family transcription factor [Candidatus Omnitrophota bacterium]